MNKKIQHLALATAIVSSSALLPQISVAAEASLTGNAGILSDYIFRGIPQNDSSGNGGIDFEYLGFYAGTWLADVGDGIEYDIYGGYVHEFENGLYLGAGYTTYQYSDNFDDEYNEVNLYAGWSNDVWSLDIEYTNGDYNGVFLDNAGNIEGDEYDFFAITGGWNGVYLTYGEFGDDADDAGGNYFEFGYGFEVGGFDVTAAFVQTEDANLLGDPATDDDEETQVYFGLHHTFDIMKWGS